MNIGRLYFIVDSEDNILKLVPRSSPPNARADFYDFVITLLPPYAIHVEEQPEGTSPMYGDIKFTEAGWYLYGELILPDDYTKESVSIGGDKYYLITATDYMNVNVNITQTRNRLDRLYAEMLEERDLTKIDDLVTKIVEDQRKYYLHTGLIYGRETPHSKRMKESNQWKNRLNRNEL